MELKRSTGDDRHFIELISALDKHLAAVFGVKQEYYNQFNVIDDSGTVVVAYEGEIPVGCGCLRKFDARTVEVKRMFVPAEHRGKGIATAILLELEKWARELNYNCIILETGTLLTEANKLYKKQGYRVTENWGPYAGVETSVCMKKAL